MEPHVAWAVLSIVGALFFAAIQMSIDLRRPPPPKVDHGPPPNYPLFPSF